MATNTRGKTTRGNTVGLFPDGYCTRESGIDTMQAVAEFDRERKDCILRRTQPGYARLMDSMTYRNRSK